MAHTLSVLMAGLLGLVGFWSTQTTNLWMVWWGIGSFASGWIAPLELMPRWLETAAAWLPFRYTMGFPVELLMGRLSWPETALGLLAGLAWSLVFGVLYRVVWGPAVSQHQAVAG